MAPIARNGEGSPLRCNWRTHSRHRRQILNEEGCVGGTEEGQAIEQGLVGEYERGDKGGKGEVLIYKVWSCPKLSR